MVELKEFDLYLPQDSNRQANWIAGPVFKMLHYLLSDWFGEEHTYIRQEDVKKFVTRAYYQNNFCSGRTVEDSEWERVRKNMKQLGPAR